jgi:hypothetical protein
MAGYVVGIFDPWGRDLAIWIPSYASIGAASSSPEPQPPPQPEDPTNLILNGSAQQALDHWTKSASWSGPIVDIDPGTTYAGLPTMRVAQNAAPTPAIVNQLDGGGAFLYATVLGVRYLDISAVAQTNGTAGTTATVTVGFYDSAGALLSLVNGPTWGASDTTFSSRILTIDVPANAIKAHFALWVQDGLSNATAWFTQVAARVSERVAPVDIRGLLP